MKRKFNDFDIFESIIIVLIIIVIISPLLILVITFFSGKTVENTDFVNQVGIWTSVQNTIRMTTFH